MTIALGKDAEAVIDEMIAAGKFATPTDVIAAGLRALATQEAPMQFPPGSLIHLYTNEENDFEIRSAKASSLKVDSET